jgi:hypothetical protein
MQLRPHRLWVIALATIGICLTAQPSHAAYTFESITNTTGSNAAAGEAQLQMTVNAGPLANQVTFEFRAIGTTPMSICDVYFDDGSLLGIASIVGSTGVNFSQGASPPNLPAGNTINFNTTSGFLADSDSPVFQNGVNEGPFPTGEWLKVTFNLINGKTLTDVEAALALGLANPGVDVEGGLRVGLHVQAIGTNEGSESFVNGPDDGGGGGNFNIVPAPAGLILFASAVPMLALRRLIRRKPAA